MSMLPGSCQHHISALHRMKISRVWSCLVPTTQQLAAPTELCSGQDHEEFFPRLHYSLSQQTFSQAVVAWDCCSRWQLAGKHGTAGPAFQPYGFHGDTDLETNAQAPVGCGGQSKPPLIGPRGAGITLCNVHRTASERQTPKLARTCYDFKRNERLHVF